MPLLRKIYRRKEGCLLAYLVKDPVELMKTRLSRRGYNMEDSEDLLKNRKGDLMYLRKRALRQSNIKDVVKRFC